jgi:3-methyladenine DNA glycosylase AlkD
MRNPAKHLVDALRSQRNPRNAEIIKGYLKTSSLGFYGIKLPIIRKLAKEHSEAVALEDSASFLDELWKVRIFDARRAAAEGLLHFIKCGMPPSQALALIDAWIDDIDTWALTDPLGWCVGELLIKSPQIRQILREWGTSEHIWRRRMAVVPFLELMVHRRYRSEYASLILEALTPLLGDPEFFVGKAVGWVLRQLSVHEPQLVRRFIMENKPGMTSLVLRESSRKLR